MRRIRVLALACGGLLVLQQGMASAADWPQYRGPDQTGVSKETINADWPADGPKVLWKIPTKNGFSSFAVAGGKAYTQVNREIGGKKREICMAVDATTGKELWATDIGVGEYPAGGDSGAPNNRGGDGPRSTPTVSEGRVYVCTQNLAIQCLDAETGKQVWAKDLLKQYHGRNIAWNSAESAVVDGDLVFTGGGGAGESFLAFNKETGKLVWKSQDELITHSTPTVATILGQRQVIYFAKSGLVSVDAKDGKALWRFPFRFNVSTAISPVVADDVVYCSAGYGIGGGACKISKDGDEFKATKLWEIAGDQEVANHWSTPVYRDGYLYGMFSFKKYGTGPLKCVEVATGKIQWSHPGFGAGNVILAGDRIIALTDTGEVVLVEASPKAYKELARVKAVTGKCWSTPALSDGRLYVRSTKEGACLDVR